MRRATVASCILLGLIVLAGCNQGDTAPGPEPIVLRDACVQVIADLLNNSAKQIGDSSMTPQAVAKATAAHHQFQMLALEIVGRYPRIAQPAWFEQALASRHDGVCFAAMQTIGRLASYDGGRLCRPFVGSVRDVLTNDLASDATGRPTPRNPYIHLIAGFACYRLTNNPEAIAFLPDYLAGRIAWPVLGEPLSQAQQAEMIDRLRAETIMVLSLMPELSPREMIESVKGDASPIVQSMAGHRLAVLGDSESLKTTLNMVRVPRADEALSALMTLEEAKLTDLEPLRVLLEQRAGGMFSRYPVWLIPLSPEVRVAAARTLAVHGQATGLDLALQWLSFSQNRDLPAEERLPAQSFTRDELELYETRVRVMSALALGAIGNYDRAAGPLLAVVRTAPSMRLRLAAARAGLELLERSGRWPG